MKSIIFLVIFLRAIFAYLSAFSQTTDIQLLSEKLANYPKADTTKIRLITQLAWEKYYFNQDTSLVLLNQSLTLAEKLNDKTAIALANREMIYYYACHIFKNYDKALNYAIKAFEFIEKSPDNLQSSLILLDIGHLFFLKNQFSEALRHYFKALKRFETLKNQEYITYTLLDIKVTYEKMNNREKAEIFKEKLNSAINKIKDKKQLARLWLCITMADFWKFQYNEVLNNTLKSEEIYEEIGDIKRLRFTTTFIVFTFHAVAKSYNDLPSVSKTIDYSNSLLALIKKDNNLSFNSIGLQDKCLAYYFNIAWDGLGLVTGVENVMVNNLMGWVNSHNNRNIEKAEEYHFKAKTIAEKEKDTFGLNLSIDGLGQVYMRKGKYQEALDLFLQISNDNFAGLQRIYVAQCYQKLGKLKEALQYALITEKMFRKEKNYAFYSIISEVLAEIYADLKQYDQAYLYQKKAREVNDSLKIQENLQKITALEKQQEIKLLEKDKEIQTQVNQNQRLWLFTALGAFVLMLALAFILYRNNQNKQKANKLLAEQKEEIKTTLDLVEQERQKSDNLLLNILPAETAQELKEKGSATPQHYDLVSVLFTDFKGFSQIAEKLSPQEVIENLNTCFLALDEICEKYNLEKIKTIGDSYMCAGGIPVANTSNPMDCVQAGLEMQTWMMNWKAEKQAKGELAWELRLGIHSGEVIAGVVGMKKFAYDIWGDTVNTASRMESSGEVGKVNISGATYELVKDKFQCTYRGKIEAKNKGEIAMYFVNK